MTWNGQIHIKKTGTACGCPSGSNRAIALYPEVLICDEATSALDVSIQQEIMALLKEKHRARQERSKAAFSAIDAVRQKISADRRLRF